MYPTLENIRQLAQTKEYRRIPLCRELYADRYTPVEVMRILRKASRHCYLLESASQTEVWGRYSFLGYEPSMEITCTDGTLKIRTTDAEGKTEEAVRQVTHPGDTLREIIRKYKTPVMEKMPPFTGGLVGYFSYDYIKYSEPKLKLEDREQQDFRDIDLTKSSKSPASIAKSNKQWVGTCLYQKGYKPLLINCEAVIWL